MISLGVVRGSVPALSKIVTMNKFDPILYAGCISLFGGCILLLIYSMLGWKTRISWSMIKFALFGGLFGISLPHALFFMGVKHVDVGIAAAMISGIPIQVYILSLILKTEMFNPLRFFGVVIAMLGVGLICSQDISADNLISTPLIGLTLLLAATFFYASNVLYIAIFLPAQIPRIQAAAFMMILGSFPVWLYILLNNDFSWVIRSFTYKPFNIVLVHCCVSAIAYWLSFHIISQFGTVTYAIAANLMVAFGMLAGIIVFDETYSAMTLLGALSIVLGVLAVTLTKIQKGTEPRLEPPQT